MRPLLILLLTTAIALSQTQWSSVTVNKATGVLAAPTNFWTANADGIAAALGFPDEDGLVVVSPAEQAGALTYQDTAGHFANIITSAAARNFLLIVPATNSMPFWNGSIWANAATSAEGRGLLAVSPSANQMYYYTGSAWSAVTTSAGGRPLMAATGTANTIPYFSALNTVGNLTVSTAGQAVLNLTGTANTIPYFSSLNTLSYQATGAAGLAFMAIGGSSGSLYYWNVSSWAAITTTTASRAFIASTYSANQLPMFDGTSTWSGVSTSTDGRNMLVASNTTAQWNYVRTVASSGTTWDLTPSGSATNIDVLQGGKGTGSTTFNNSQTNTAFTIKGTGDANLFRMDLLNAKVTIGLDPASSTSKFHVMSTSATQTIVTVQGTSGQIGDSLLVLDSTGNLLFSVDSAGNVLANSFSTTGPVTVANDAAYVSVDTALALPTTGNLVMLSPSSAANKVIATVTGGNLGTVYFVVNTSPTYTITFTNSSNVECRGGVDLVLGTNESATVVVLSSTQISVH